MPDTSIDKVQFPNKNCIEQIVKSARENKCLIIVDEVTTGFGRLGQWFGYHIYNLKPDIATTGKALGKGYPISAVSINTAVADMFAKNPFRYVLSHQNDPLGYAIGLEVIRIIEEQNLIQRSKETGFYFFEQLTALKAIFPDKIKAVRAKGLMIALEFSEQLDGELINQQLFNNGFIVGYKANVLRFLPPLVITENNILKLTKMIQKILTDKL